MKKRVNIIQASYSCPHCPNHVQISYSKDSPDLPIYKRLKCPECEKMSNMMVVYFSIIVMTAKGEIYTRSVMEVNEAKR